MVKGRSVFRYLLVGLVIVLVFRLDNVSAIVDESGVDYFEEYAEMEANSKPENILIVKSEDRPEDYGAERVVEISGQVYFLQYKTIEERDLAWKELKQDDSIRVVPNVVLAMIEEGEEELEEEESFMSWGIEAMGLDYMIKAIEEHGDAKNVLVAVVDTGVKSSVFREYFPERTLHEYCVATCEDGMDDTVGHGTRVIGIIAEGTASNVELLAIRAGVTQSFTVGNMLTSIEYAVEQGANVINVSAGGVFDFDNEDYYAPLDMTWGEIYRQVWEIEKETIDAAAEAGTIIIASSGNGGGRNMEYPASYDTAISVGAVNGSLELASFSNYNEYLDYVAPGVMINSLNSRYTGEEGQSIKTLDQGTSMASPHIAAAVAGLKSFNKNLSLEEVFELLNSRAIDLGDEGRDDYYGNGFVNFKEAEFCKVGAKCDKYGVFIDNSPLPDEEEKGEVEDDESEIEITVPNAGKMTKIMEEIVTTNSFGLVMITGTVFWFLKKKQKKDRK